MAISTPLACRLVTPEECDFYQAHGWVQLRGFVDPEVLAAMLRLAKEKMGDDADGDGINIDYATAAICQDLTHPVLKPLIDAAAQSAKLLMRRTAVGVRYYTDAFLTKLPSERAASNAESMASIAGFSDAEITSTKHSGNGPTPFHTDFVSLVLDRSGSMTFWIPLEAYGAEFGTMSFISGSHKTGVKGQYATYGEKDIRDVYPELRDLAMSEPINYELGDVTVHSDLTVHGAGLNVTDRPRWAYFLGFCSEDARWTGAPTPNFDATAMTPFEPLSDDRFPILT